MGQKKIYSYVICFFAVVILMAFCYLISYTAASNKFNTQLEQQKQMIVTLQKELKEQAAAMEKEEVIPANQAQDGRITPSTKYILEIYDLKKDTFTEHTLNPPDYLIGLTREQVIDYMNQYMTDPPLDEFQKGLVSYDMISFSEDKVVLRKSYNIDSIPYQYYMSVEKGMVVVYYADKKTVYEYTGIETVNLPEEEQVKLSYGIFVKDIEELYDILQNYSS